MKTEIFNWEYCAENKSSCTESPDFERSVVIKMKKATYRYFINDKEGNPVNIDTLTLAERKEVGQWAYKTMLEALGYRAVEDEKSFEETEKKTGSEKKNNGAPITGDARTTFQG